MLNTTCACMLAPVVLRGTGQTRFQRSEESELSHSKCISFFFAASFQTRGVSLSF